MYAKIKDSTQLFLLLLPVAENNVLLYSKDEPLGSRLLDGVRKNRQLHNILKKKPFTTNDPGRDDFGELGPYKNTIFWKAAKNIGFRKNTRRLGDTFSLLSKCRENV